jgi:hypothetical protein
MRVRRLPGEPVAVIRGAADELLGRGSLAVVSHEVDAHPRFRGAVGVQGNSSSGLPPRRD